MARKGNPPMEIIRKSRTSGGLLENEDRIIVRAIADRNNNAIQGSPNQYFTVKLRSYPSNRLIEEDFDPCEALDFDNCGPSRSCCYCSGEPVKTQKYDVVINITAQLAYSERFLSFMWSDEKNGATGYSTQLPVVCKTITATLKVNDVPISLTSVTGKEINIVNVIQFCVTDLKGNYSVKIQLTSGPSNSTHGAQCAVFTNLTKYGNVDAFELSYSEPADDGCGRNGSYNVIFEKGEGFRVVSRHTTTSPHITSDSPQNSRNGARNVTENEIDETKTTSSSSDDDLECGSFCIFFSVLLLVVVLSCLALAVLSNRRKRKYLQQEAEAEPEFEASNMASVEGSVASPTESTSKENTSVVSGSTWDEASQSSDL